MPRSSSHVPVVPRRPLGSRKPGYTRRDGGTTGRRWNVGAMCQTPATLSATPISWPSLSHERAHATRHQTPLCRSLCSCMCDLSAVGLRFVRTEARTSSFRPLEKAHDRARIVGRMRPGGTGWRNLRSGAAARCQREPLLVDGTASGFGAGPYLLYRYQRWIDARTQTLYTRTSQFSMGRRGCRQPRHD
jgi:hypothetical protein